MTRAATQWAAQSALWRDPAEAVSLHRADAAIDRRMLAGKASRDFWGLVASLDITLLVGREYEHFVMGLTVRRGRPHVTYMPLPHPSGIAVDPRRGTVFIASTRNPNQIYTFRPLVGLLARRDRAPLDGDGRPLMPVAAQFLPGSLYVHDLALVGGALHASAAGHNAVVRIADDGFAPAWWPRCIEKRRTPDFGRNYIQLNSIAAGQTLADSFFSASSEAIGRRFPGQPDYPVDGRGVIFSGATRAPVVRGLTRPHSARLWRRRLWVDNSGYGQFGTADGERFVPVAQLPGWTRGLAFAGGYAFVGVSRVIPRFSAYAPGVDVAGSVCGLFVIEVSSGRIVASMVWPNGNQIFAVETIPARLATGFPYPAARQGSSRQGSSRQAPSPLERLFYGFQTSSHRTTRK
jgi:uncharacterized protein (TIGR03032 family)